MKTVDPKFVTGKIMGNAVEPIADPTAPRPAEVGEDLRQQYKGATSEERQRLIHKHDCPKAWAFFDKHAVGSKLAPSCFMCGKVSSERAIQHLELPDIYICVACASRPPTAQEGWVRVPRVMLEYWLKARITTQDDGDCVKEDISKWLAAAPREQNAAPQAGQTLTAAPSQEGHAAAPAAAPDWVPALVILQRHRRQIEQSPGVGAEVQRYALAVCDDLETDLRQLLPKAATALRAAPSPSEPDGWAVQMADGHFVGLYTREDTAQLVASRNRSGRDNVMPMFFRAAPSLTQQEAGMIYTALAIISLNGADVAFIDALRAKVLKMKDGK